MFKNTYQLSRRHRVNLATSATGHLGPKKAMAVHSDVDTVWIPTAVGLRPCPAESETGPMQKMPRRGDGYVSDHTKQRWTVSNFVSQAPRALVCATPLRWRRSRTLVRTFGEWCGSRTPRQAVIKHKKAGFRCQGHRLMWLYWKIPFW